VADKEKDDTLNLIAVAFPHTFFFCHKKKVCKEKSPQKPTPIFSFPTNQPYHLLEKIAVRAFRGRPTHPLPKACFAKTTKSTELKELYCLLF